MNYQPILKRLEDEKKDQVLSAKLFRYTGLMQAIEFFSQKLVFEQIIDAAFDFVNELLLVNKSAIYTFEKNRFIVKKTKGFSHISNEIKSSERLEKLATFYGTVLYGKDNIAKYLDFVQIDELDIEVLVPLIIEDRLYGFIIISERILNEDDYIISESLMKLINTALENFSRYEKLVKVNTELDEKVFNLFAINQSSKVLLSELRMDVLYSISVDVFSELTHSTMTGFVLLDDKSMQYSLKSFKDIFYKVKKISVSLSLAKGVKIDPNKVIINTSSEEDVNYFNSLFEEGIEEISELNAKYIVLILKSNQIFGFVTLGEIVTGHEYGQSIFELIESLASSTYTALSNAKLFGEVNEQKRIIQSKLNKVISLNNLTKNINSSSKVETLMELTAKTLEISFNVSKGIICTYNNEAEVFEAVQCINLEAVGRQIQPNSSWKRVFEGDTVYGVGNEIAREFAGEEFSALAGDVQGILVIPIYIDIMEVDMLGCIIIFDFEYGFIDNEELILTMETIAGHIAPVLNNLSTIKQQQKFMLPNYIELFKQELKQEINSAIECEIDLTVVQILDTRDFVFKGNTILESLKEEFKHIYPFSYNNIFIIDNDVHNDIIERIAAKTGIPDLQVRKLKLFYDFNSFAEFFNLFK